jgi:PIN domain nuclease of toxin-antitoxin system
MGRSGVILFDTHVVLWSMTAPEKLSRNAKEAIEDARRSADGMAICDVTLLELATNANKGRILLDISLESFLQAVESRFVVLPISGLTCARTALLPVGYPKDPADRIIGATALVQGLTLLTSDREIRRSKAVRTIW